MRPDFISSQPLSSDLICEPQPYGSFIVRGGLYDVLSARGTVAARQDLATKLGVRLYVEQHLNASKHRSPRYACAFIAQASNPNSRPFAVEYVRLCASILGLPNGGVSVGPSNCGRMRCPSFLAEPGFISNPEFSAFAKTGEGTEAIAKCLVEAIKFQLPGGGLVGLSVGHAYRGNRDPGAPSYRDPEGGEDPAYDDEAEIADGIVNLATELLVAIQDNK
jgi:hypothetical protein